MKKLVSLFSLAASIVPAAELPPKKYDLGSGSISGDVVMCPRTITATHLNVLRYRYKFNSVVTFAQAPDLWSKLTELAAPTAAPAPTQRAAPPPPGVAKGRRTKADCRAGKGVSDPKIMKHVCDAQDVENAVTQRIEKTGQLTRTVAGDYASFRGYVSAANTATRTVKTAGKALTDFLGMTGGDPQQTIAGTTAVLGYAQGAAPPTQQETTFMSGVNAHWPDVTEIANLAQDVAGYQGSLNDESDSFHTFVNDNATKIGGLLRDLQDDLAGLNETEQALVQIELDDLKVASMGLDAASHDLATAMSQNAKMNAGLPDLQQGSQTYLDFVAARDLLITWQRRMETVRAELTAHPDDASSLSTHADSEFSFARTKTTAITLVAEDLMPGSTAPAQTVLSVTAECTSPFTVSAGIAFSTIKEREYAIQPQDSTGKTNVIEAVAKSSFHPLPLAMIHARLWEPSEWLSVHASFGLAGNIRSQGAGGSDAEFILGPSLCFFRTMFLTPGLHLGREVSLAGGFREGDSVPSTITTPPLQKAYKAAFGFAITFTKP